MTVGRVFVTGLKVLAVCLVFASCFAAGVTLSGLTKIAQQAPPAEQAISTLPEAPAKPQPEKLLGAFLIFSVSVGVVLSYLILRSSWHGWPLVGAICVGIYGVSTVATQVDSLFSCRTSCPAE